MQAAAVRCLVIFLHRFATTALRAGSILPLIAAVTAHQAEQRCAAGEPGRGEGAAYKGTHKSLSPRGVVPRRGGRAAAAWTLPTAPRQAGTRRRGRATALSCRSDSWGAQAGRPVGGAVRPVGGAGRPLPVRRLLCSPRLAARSRTGSLGQFASSSEKRHGVMPAWLPSCKQARGRGRGC